MENKRMPSVVEQVRGVSYKPTDLHTSLDKDSITLLRANNIEDGKIIFSDVVFVDRKCVSTNQILKKGDILICASSGSRNLVGKAASFSGDGEYTFGAFCKVVRPHYLEDADYIAMYFQSPIYRRLISEAAQGININNIRNEHIDALTVKWGSNDMRRQIVERLQTLKIIIQQRHEQLNILDQLIKARFVEMFGGGKYRTVKAAEVCDFITKGTTPPTGEIVLEYRTGLIPFLKVYNLSFTGELLFDAEPQYVSTEIHSGKLARSKVYPNDVLMNIVGPPLGKFSLVTDEFAEWNINQAIAIFRSKKGVLPRYLLAALMQPKVLRPFLEQAVGIRQLNLSLEQCRNLEFPLPPIEEQERFVEFSAQVDKSKVVVQAALDEVQLLFDSLMQQYFG